MFLFPIISENIFYILIHKYHNVNYFIFYIQYFDYLIIRGGNRSEYAEGTSVPSAYSFFGKIGLSEGETAFEKNRLSPSDSPFPKTSDFGGFGLSEGETAFGKNRLSPSGSPFPKTSDFFGIVRYPRGKPLLEKIGCPPRTPLSRKSLLFIILFYPLIQVNASIKLLIRIKYSYNLPYSKNVKRKSGYIKNINNEVLGKGERERENRFYKIGFPLAEK